jgi:RNA polymerase nonessential primary-like sigma factor
MNTVSRIPPQTRSAVKAGPHFLFHPSFAEPDAEQTYGGVPGDEDESLGFMPDETTRDCAKRMHYAAWRASLALTGREATYWRGCYYDCRDRIVVGNRKLTFRAVQKWASLSQLADDMAGECQIVLIKAVAVFNPWLGIRFSTYAFTCLMRALSRLARRQAADRLSRSLPLGSLPCGEPCYTISEQATRPDTARLEEFLQEGHTLLTPREKTVLMRRYHFNENVPQTETLEQVGRTLGLSKERVRQVQSAALGKLRAALLAEPSRS